MSYWIFAVPLVSALIGYVTNWVAIHMLFRPYEEKRIWGLRVPFTPGLIPKRRGELAGSIGRSVSRYLLTGEAVSARLKKDDFRRQVDQLIEGLAQRWLQRELPSVNAMVPEKFKPEWDRWLNEAKGRLDGWLESLLANPEFVGLIEQQVQAQLHRWLDAPLQELLPTDVLDELPERLADVLQRLIESQNLRQHIDQFFSQRLAGVVEEDKSLNDLLPQRLKEVAFEKLDDAVPLILDRFVKILEDDRIRKHIKIHLFDLLDDMLNKQFREESVWDQFKFGLMESFVITPEEIKARIEDAVDSAAPRMAELVRREDVRQRVHQALVDTIERFLNKPFSEFNVEAQTMSDLKAKLSEWVVKLVQSETLKVQLVKLVGDQIEQHRSQPLRELLPNLKEETVARTTRRISEALIRWLQGETVRQKVSAFVSSQADALLARPVGRLDRFLSESALTQAKEYASEKTVAFLIHESPEILKRLDVEQLVSEQVGEFSLPEVERLILGITGRQLRAITWFGALLGFVIGLFQLLLMWSQG